MEEKESQDTCDIVQDLLPLYHDGVLSDAAKRYVERHLGTCPLCREKQKKLENGCRADYVPAPSGCHDGRPPLC